MNGTFENKMGSYKRLKALGLALVLGVFSLGSSNVAFAGHHGGGGGGTPPPPTCNGIGYGGACFAGLPSLTAPSLPAFGTVVQATFTKGSSSSTLKVNNALTSTSVFLTPSNIYSIGSTSYSLTANFNSSGNFTTGNISISGKFNGSGTSSLLMTADLTSFAKSSNGYLWGFNTSNIWCNSAINTAANGCTTAEVVYLGLASAQKSLTKSWKTYGVALTSVPVPAAAWLFGSGLLGLVSVARRKS